MIRELSAEERIVFDQLRGPAVAAGIVDAEALRLGDLNSVKLDKGVVVNADEFVAALKQAKPHLFSSNGTPKAALSLGKQEYARSRRELLRGHPHPSAQSAGAKELLGLSKQEYELRRRAVIK